MSMGCVLALVIFVALFLSSMPEGSVERQGVDGLFIGSQLSAFAPMPDVEERMMEQIWSNCKLDLLEEKSLMRLVDKNILDENAGSTNRHAGHPTRLLVQNTISRKLLAGQSVNENFPSSIFLAPALMPKFQNQVSKTASAPPGQLTSHTLFPSSDAPMTEDNFENFSPNPLPGGDFVPEVNDPSSRYASAPSERKDNKTKTIIITAVVTATVTVSLAACFFCCFYRYLMNKYQFPNGEREDRPLLSVSLNDFSVSSHVDFGHTNSFHNNKNGALSLTTEANQNGHTALLNSQTDFQADSLPSAFASLTEPTNAIGHALEPAPSSPVKHPTGTMVSSPPFNPSPTLVNPKAPPAPPKGGPLLPKATPPPKGGPPLPKGSLHPPPPKGPPRPPQPSSSSSAVPLPPSHHSSNPFSSDTKTKLKPFFWDKVTANPDQSMVWHQIKSGSFQFNEEMIETLFGYSAKDKHWNDTKKDSATNPSFNRIQILDPKKSQNLAISLKAWNVRVEEICDALMEGNELPIELLQILLRMAPTTDEELKLKLFNDNMALLGPAELFLKTVVNVPFAFKRMEALLLMTTLQEESTFVKESLATVEEACKELRNSRLFLKLLEAVLKTGNRMNDGTYRGRAQAFKLDTLLKLSDVKGADGKTTLLHFVVQEIIQSEGQRAMRVARESRSNPSINSDNIMNNVSEQSEGQYCILGLEVVSSLSSELENVKRSAGLDADALTGVVTSLGQRLVKTKEFLNTDMRNLMEESNFHTCLKAFVEHAEADLSYLFEEEKRIRLLVKNTTDYFHGSAGRDEGLRLFVIVRDFMGMLDKVCREVRKAAKKELKVPRQKYSLTSQLIAEPQQLIFPTIKEHHIDDFSSDGE